MTDIMPDQGARNWLYKYARKQLWRVSDWMDYDDLVQDGYEAYFETRRRYPDAVDPPHIMTLFQLVFRSHIENMVKRRGKQIDASIVDRFQDKIFDDETVSMQWEPSVESEFDLHALILMAPKAVREVLALFTDEKSRKELQKPYEGRETKGQINKRFCELLGKNPEKVNLVEKLEIYFS